MQATTRLKLTHVPLILAFSIFLFLPMNTQAQEDSNEISFVYSLEMIQKLADDTEAIEISMLGDEVFDALLRFSSLKSIAFSSSKTLSDRGIARLTNFKNLSAIHISSCEQITNKSMAILSKIKALKDIEVTNCKNVTAKGISKLNRLKNVLRLGIFGVEIDNRSLGSIIKAHPRLERFSINCATFDDKCAIALSRLKNLNQLTIHNGVITKKSLKKIVKLPRLESLNVTSCHKLKKKDALLLKKCMGLKELKLDGEFCRGLTSIKSMPLLEKLTISGNDAGEVLAGFTRSNYPKLRSLDLDTSHGINADVLNRIARKLDLEFLDLSWQEDIDQESLLKLIHSKSLKKLMLNEDAMKNRAMFAELKKGLKGCRIILH